ncbi:uncharacterized protein N7529_003462 [Penicillium soppii]|uniref:uncharacterized protein n=1 Tax=Penicillium soppii TaxID=69789 RepID=UPI002547D272|nr:uncharacterized protein N7529_003462 [Penicillium soppii]KAJ5871109.1 hypothetical protein N7529_003462 [Penicillium soppii]
MAYESFRPRYIQPLWAPRSLSVHVRSWAEVQKRAGFLAVTHLVPLCSGFSFSLPAYVYRVERGTLQWAHRWLGRVCALHCLLYRSVLGTVARNTRLAAPLVIPLVTLAAILQRWPQLGLKIHYVLATVATGALTYHLIDRASAYRWVLLGDHPHWVGNEISQILELDRMFDRNDCLEHRHRDDRGFDILQFTTHILDTQPMDRIHYRNRTRLKYHFYAINIDKESAYLTDGRGGTTAVSVCASKSTRAAVRRIVHSRTSGDCRLIDLELEPSYKWWADSDPFVYDTIASPREPSNAGRIFEPGWPPTAMPVAYPVPRQATRLSRETLVDNRRSWQSDDSAFRGQSANHKKWVRQKLTEGGV